MTWVVYYWLCSSMKLIDNKNIQTIIKNDSKELITLDRNCYNKILWVVIWMFLWVKMIIHWVRHAFKVPLTGSLILRRQIIPTGTGVFLTNSW